MTNKKVITKIQRIPIHKMTEGPVKTRFASNLLRKQQRDVWRTVVRYFAEGNGEDWKKFKNGIDEETDVEITYNPKSDDEAEEELNNIKSKAFAHLGQATLQRIKRKFKADKKIQDDHPTFEKLRRNLTIYQIFLEVYITES